MNPYQGLKQALEHPRAESSTVPINMNPYQGLKLNGRNRGLESWSSN